MPVQPAALELLIALAPVANRWGRWYGFGAQAVILYGVSRLSADVDVTLALEPEPRKGSSWTWRPPGSACASTIRTSFAARA